MAFILALPILKTILDNPIFDAMSNALDKLSDIESNIEMRCKSVKRKLNTYADELIHLGPESTQQEKGSIVSFDTLGTNSCTIANTKCKIDRIHDHKAV